MPNFRRLSTFALFDVSRHSVEHLRRRSPKPQNANKSSKMLKMLNQWRLDGFTGSPAPWRRPPALIME
jgi:hypothetical protein